MRDYSQAVERRIERRDKIRDAVQFTLAIAGILAILLWSGYHG